MKRGIFFLAALAAWLFVLEACKPNLSDMEVELVDTGYISKLPSIADTVYTLVLGGDAKAMGAVNESVYVIGGGQKKLRIAYDAFGKVLQMVESRNGTTVDSVAFYPNGQRIFKLSFTTGGIADGSARFYYSDGRVREDGRFTNGIKTGVWRLFSPDGRLKETHEFDNYGMKLR